MKRKFRIIITFDSDYYDGCTDALIADYISKEVAPSVAKAYNVVPSYIGTSVEVVTEANVDEIPIEKQESEG